VRSEKWGSENLKNLMSARGLCKSFDSSGVRIDILKDLDFDLDQGD
jgi:hypothetical protein